MDEERYYVASDITLLLDTFKTEISFLKVNWMNHGRPTIAIVINSKMIGGSVSTLFVVFLVFHYI